MRAGDGELHESDEHDEEEDPTPDQLVDLGNDRVRRLDTLVGGLAECLDLLLFQLFGGQADDLLAGRTLDYACTDRFARRGRHAGDGDDETGGQSGDGKDA